jgi:hypothetical protein
MSMGSCNVPNCHGDADTFHGDESGSHTERYEMPLVADMDCLGGCELYSHNHTRLQNPHTESPRWLFAQAVEDDVIARLTDTEVETINEILEKAGY